MRQLGILFLFCYIHISGQPSVLPIDASHSVISFRVGFAGNITNIEGRFNAFAGEIGYKHPGDKSSLFINVTIDVASINTGDLQRDQDLMEEAFFDVSNFPKITFTSTSTTQTTDGYLMSGTLDLAGKRKVISIPFEYAHEDPVAWVFGEPRIAAKATIKLDRTEFGIPKQGWDTMIPSLGALMLDKEVEIRLVVHGVGPGLSALLIDKAREEGAESAMANYRELQKKFKGQQTYNFGAGTLARVSLKLAQSGLLDEALVFAQSAIAENSNSAVGYYALGVVQKSNNETQKAIVSFEKALEINAEFDQAKMELQKLKGNGE